jgi:release factor glutamine methyltransferase
VQLAAILASSGIDPLDAELLLAQVLGQTRAWLAAHPDAVVSTEHAEQFAVLAMRRAKHEPLAYILGVREFYGRSFRVTPDTLIPRPATEALVTLALDVLRTGTPDVRQADSGIVAGAELFGALEHVRTVVDVGTGSGCIAITLACERTDLHCIGIDVSAGAIAVATENAERHGVADRCVFSDGALLDPINDLDAPFLLVSNPPYIPLETALMPDVAGFEPSIALFAGEDGMQVLRPLVAEARAHPLCRGMVLECMEEQWEALAKHGE